MRNQVGIVGQMMRWSFVFVFVMAFGGEEQSVHAQCETKIIASDGESGDGFGISVSIDGDVFVVGALKGDGNVPASGSAYVYRYDGFGWIEEAGIFASDGALGVDFGCSISVDGDVVVVGAYHDDDNSDDAGSAYVFRYNGSDWIEEAKLLASDGAEMDYFGYTVSISGDVIVVGAHGDDDNGDHAGSAYVYRYNGVTWIEETKLLASDGGPDDWFGCSVSVDGDAIVVGARGYDENHLWSDKVGSVYVYRYDPDGSGVWVAEAQILKTDGVRNDYFGRAVSIDGDTIVVGESNNRYGLAHVFRYDPDEPELWIEEAELISSDNEYDDKFGNSISIEGDVIVFGTYGNDDDGNYSGTAYVFRYDRNGSGEWIEETKLFPSDGNSYLVFGGSVSIDSDTIVVGADGDDHIYTNAGSAYVYDLGCDPPPTLVISPDPLISNETVQLNGTNLKPNSRTFLAYSLTGLGSTHIPPLNITLDLADALGIHWVTTTDSWGHHSIIHDFHVPPNGHGIDIWFQAFQYELKTNVVATSVE